MARVIVVTSGKGGDTILDVCKDVLGKDKII